MGKEDRRYDRGPDERNRLEIAEQVGNGDVDMVAGQESWEQEGAGIGYIAKEYAWIGRKRKEQKFESRDREGKDP